MTAPGADDESRLPVAAALAAGNVGVWTWDVRTDRVFAAVVVVALVSLVLFLIVQLAARLATPWLSASASTRRETR